MLLKRPWVIGARGLMDHQRAQMWIMYEQIMVLSM
jgi:hypothetical protein